MQAGVMALHLRNRSSPQDMCNVENIWPLSRFRQRTLMCFNRAELSISNTCEFSHIADVHLHLVMAMQMHSSYARAESAFNISGGHNAFRTHFWGDSARF
jgi:hypothetical protein